MRDLDKYLAEQLGEEDSFPGREANWRTLHYRLEAAAARRTTLYWQIASGMLLLLLAALGWQSFLFFKENKRLIARLSAAETALSAAVLRADSLAQASLLPAPQKTIEPKRSALRWRQTDVAESALPALLTPSPLSPLTTEETATKAETSAEETPALVSTPEPLLRLASIRTLPLRSFIHMPPAPQWPALLPRHRESRFWIGLQGSIGVPTPRPGVSLMQGAGLGAEYRVLGQFWLTGSAEWISYDVRHTNYLPSAFYRENPPQAYKIVLGKPPVPYPLHDVVGNQRLRFLSAGLRYRVPLRFWLRPSVHVAYTLGQVAPAIYNYTFADTLPGPPPKKVIVFTSPQSTSAYTVPGLWRFGVALERETEWWTLRLGVSRQEVFRPDFYDTWWVQGSIWYKW